MLLIILLYLVVGFTLSGAYAFATGRDPRNQTPPAVKKDQLAVAAEKAPRAKVIEPAFAMTEMMFLNAVAQIIMLVLAPLVLRLTSGARLRDIGLSWSGSWRQAAIGFVAMLITTPVVYLVQLGAVSVWRPNSHPLEKMLREHFSVDVAYLALLTGVILAPMLEEITFRGIFQRWLIHWIKRREYAASPRVMHLELERPETGADVESRAAEYWEADERPDDLAKNPGSENVRESGRAVRKAIIMTSLFFASVHAAQWPAPIPIFVLSLVLGTVYYRTGGLIAPICMHGAFNGLSTLMMFAALLAGPEIDKKKILPEAMQAATPTSGSMTCSRNFDIFAVAVSGFSVIAKR